MINKNNIKLLTLNAILLWIIFILYIVLLSIGIYYHELWGDEIHSWNIAKGSTNFFDLISNTRYEGHPPIWYSILWIISKYTHDMHYMQLAQLIIASVVVFIVLFFSPFPIITRILIPFGYYFLFDYGILSRNYAIGVLFALCMCLIIRRNFKYKIVLYYLLLFLMSNTHLIALLLAGSLHLYFLVFNIEKNKNRNAILLHIVLGAIVFLPAVYFILPPSNSKLDMIFWTNRWSSINLFAFFTSPLRSFIPIPAWWNYNFWNTQFLLEIQSTYSIVKLITPVVILVVLGIILFILKRNKKSLILFTANFLLTFIISMLYPLATTRYVGFIYIAFLVSYWLYCYEFPLSRKNKKFVNVLLIIQLLSGIFSLTKEVQFPFSNLYKVKEVLGKVPKNQKIITDYWTLNVVSAFIDKPFYCIEMKKEMTFLLWGSELITIKNTPDPYITGIKFFFEKEGVQKVYVISVQSIQEFLERDLKLSKSFKINLIAKLEGGIVKRDSLYLYEIESF